MISLYAPTAALRGTTQSHIPSPSATSATGRIATCRPDLCTKPHLRESFSQCVSPFYHHMSSQSGNTQEIAALSGHASSFVLGSQDPDSPRQEFLQSYQLTPSEMGLRYMTIPNSDDSRFSPTLQNPVYTVDSNIAASTASGISFASFPNGFVPGLSNTTSYCHGASPYFPPIHSSFVSELKPNLTLFNPNLEMAPPSRSPLLSHIQSPITTRDLYSSAAPQLRRASDLLSRPSPSASGSHRGAVPLSPSSSSGFASPANMDSGHQGNASDVPLLQETETFCQLQTLDGQQVRPEIHGKIDKGFFFAEGDWTCYRRNYFQLSCSYTLHPHLPPTSINMVHLGRSLQIRGFAMSIAAVVDGRDGTPIDLVQHTPKRDKGPQMRPDRVTLAPRSGPPMHGNDNSSRSLFDSPYGNANQPPSEYTFERIQFKQATANNGKRRAAQQYYHLLVELFADTGALVGDGRWIKIAHRISVQMVVRGRSPGHYQGERRGSNASAGAGGTTGQSGGSSTYDSNGTMGRGLAEIAGPSSMISGPNYRNAYDSRSHQYLTSANGTSLEIPADPILSSEELKTFKEFDGYLYYPATIHEPNISTALRSYNQPSYQYPGFREDRRTNERTHSPKIKQEFPIGINLPSLTAPGQLDTFGRHCGRFEGLPDGSKGYYPTAIVTHSDLNRP